MTGLRTAALTAVAMLLAFAPAASAVQGVIFVDDDRAQCPNAEAQSIQEGVLLAEPGERVHVCPGDYRETVDVDKPITLNGAGPDPHTRTADPTGEAVVDPLGPFGFIVRAPDVVLEGFTIRLASVGVLTARESTGFVIRKNLFWLNTNALELSSEGGRPSLVRENDFRENRRFAIFSSLASGPLRDTRIEVNDFERNQSSITAAGQVQSVAVENNKFADERGTGVLLNGLDNTIANNHFLRSGQPIRVSGFTPNRVASNRLEQNRGHGIVFFAGHLAVVESNRVVQQAGDGIQLQNFIRGEVRRNHVEASGRNGFASINDTRDSFFEVNWAVGNGAAGIFFETSTSRNRIDNSHFYDNVEFDCRDDTVGPFPGGVRNIWGHVLGDTANRPEICKPTGNSEGTATPLQRSANREAVSEAPCLPYASAQQLHADSPDWGDATWVCDPTAEDLGPPPEDEAA